jgi:predicted transcriptional regulator
MLYIKSNQQKTKEYQFLNEFLNTNFLTSYVDNEAFNYTLIQEPFTGLGYADLVIVVWKKDIYTKWHPERNKLIKDDIKILHHLYSCRKYKQVSEIKNELGYSEKNISKSLSRLDMAGLIKFSKNGKFKALKKSEIFYLEKIISIEAKLKDWRRALDQAINNSYYASESYTLFPQKVITDKMLDTYKETNVGIISFSCDLTVIKKARKNTIPANMNAWLFNEYIGRKFL